MDSLLSHMNEMPTKRKQILNSVIESPSTKGRYGLKKKATPERVGTTVYHDQTVNVSLCVSYAGTIIYIFLNRRCDFFP